MKKKLSQQKVCSELISLTYGSLIQDLISTHETCSLVNEQVEKMGHNIGQRLIDEYLARSDTKHCNSFQQVADNIAKNGFEMFLGVSAQVQNFKQQDGWTYFSLVFNDNPLNDFVQLPQEYESLNYSNIICGTIRGALSQLQIVAECSFVKDTLKGDGHNEIAVKMQKEVV